MSFWFPIKPKRFFLSYHSLIFEKKSVMINKNCKPWCDQMKWKPLQLHVHVHVHAMMKKSVADTKKEITKTKTKIKFRENDQLFLPSTDGIFFKNYYYFHSHDSDDIFNKSNKISVKIALYFLICCLKQRNLIYFFCCW